MSKEKCKELFEELYSCMGDYGNERTALELMKIDRLDKIADELGCIQVALGYLEHLDTLEDLRDCVSDNGKGNVLCIVNASRF